MQPARRALLAALATLGAPALPLRAQPVAAATVPPEVAAALPGARLRGRGGLRFLGLRIYEARLWVTADFSPTQWDAAPLALELEYARTLYGRLIAERSLEEMKRQGPIAPEQGERWLERMKELFPDVQERDRLTGVHRPGETASFALNGRPIGELRDGLFAHRFFAIWLGPQTSEPALRQALLGLS